MGPIIQIRVSGGVEEICIPFTRLEMLSASLLFQLELLTLYVGTNVGIKMKKPRKGLVH